LGAAGLILVTVITNALGQLGKEFSLRNGQLHVATRATVYEGRARRVRVENLPGFAQGRGKLKGNQALCYGVTAAQAVEITTHASVRPGAVSRDRANFSWPEGPGIWFIDHDGRSYGWQELDSIFASVMPEFGNAGRYWTPSNSAFLRVKQTGEVLIGAGGWRCYVVVDYAPRIPRLTDALFQRLVTAGYGHVLITVSGHRHVKTLLDRSVAQPERLDFCTPTLSPELERFGESKLIDGPPLISTYVTAEPQDAWRKHCLAVQALMLAAEPEAQGVAAAWQGRKIAEDVARGIAPEVARRKWRRLSGECEILPHDHEIQLADGTIATVADILAAPDEFHEQRCADPIDPTYRDDNRIAIIYPRTRTIFSWAHGGVKYRLLGPLDLETLMDGVEYEV
jgi:hypothetical protein